MCRLPLTYIFPHFFGTNAKNSVASNSHGHTIGGGGMSGTGNRSFRHAGTSRNDWVPEEKERGICLTTVNGRGSSKPVGSDDTSEEYILSTPAQEHLHGKASSSHELSAGRSTPDVETGYRGIHKVTQYEVTYDDRR